MKRTNQMRKAVMGTGHGNRTVRKGLLNTFASVPRNEPYPRQIRAYIKLARRTKVNMPKWAVMSTTLEWMFHRAGLYPQPEAV